MDAVKYLKEEARMLKIEQDTGMCGIGCNECPFFEENIGEKLECEQFKVEYPEKAVAIVEKWSAEHPAKTRQSEFLKMFPNASIVDGVPELNPCHVDNKFSPQKGCGNSSCGECRKEYWSEEIYDDK